MLIMVRIYTDNMQIDDQHLEGQEYSTNSQFDFDHLDPRKLNKPADFKWNNDPMIGDTGGVWDDELSTIPS